MIALRNGIRAARESATVFAHGIGWGLALASVASDTLASRACRWLSARLP